MRVSAEPVAARTRASSHRATEPGSRTTGSALTIAVICSTVGTAAPRTVPVSGTFAVAGDRA
jgi:hypothetical protein